MPGKGYTVGIASETKAFKQGIDAGIIAPLEDADDALRKIGQNTAPHKLEQQMRDAQQETKDLAGETKRTADTIEREYRSSYKSAGKASDDFTRGAGENVQGFKEEAVQNFSEVASSFTGDMSQMADGVQGLTGGLASSLTPGIGIPIAILGAAAAAFIQSWQESSEKIKQISADTFDQIASDGTGSFDSMEAYASRLKGAYADHEDEIKQIAKQLGILPATVASAWAGQADAVAVVTKATEDWRDANADAFKKGGSLASDAARDFEHLIKPMQDTWDGYDTGKKKSSEYFDNLSRDLLTSIADTKDAAVEVDNLGNKVVTLPDGKQIFIDAKTGQATADVSRFKGDVDGVIDHLNGRVVTVNFDANFADFNRKAAAAQALAERTAGRIGTAFKGAVWQ